MTNAPKKPCIKTQQELSEIYERDGWEDRLNACTDIQEIPALPSPLNQMLPGTSIVGTHYYEHHEGKRVLVAYTQHYRNADGKRIGKKFPRALLIDGQWCHT